MDDIWVFFLIPAALLIFKNEVLFRYGYIQRGGVAGKTVEWIVAVMIIIGILRAFEAKFF